MAAATGVTLAATEIFLIYSSFLAAKFGGPPTSGVRPGSVIAR